MSETDHKKYLLKALEQAQLGRGFCAPNPAVGAVVVSQSEIIAEAYHHGPGQAHAEVNALHTISDAQAKQATLYVTLEPCCHHGRTPPCTDLIIAKGIPRVIFGYFDPNVIVNHRGQQQLQQAGIDCEYVESDAINAFYQSYQYWQDTKLPWVIAKLALSQDGKIAGSHGERRQITGEELSVFTHQQRKATDAILTTAKTVIADDPMMDARTSDKRYVKSIYILDRQLMLPLDAKIIHHAKQVTVFYDQNCEAVRLGDYRTLNIKCVPVKTIQQRLCLNTILSIIGQDGVHDLWLEAGGQCFTSFVTQKLIQQAYIYIAPHRYLGDDALSAFDSETYRLLAKAKTRRLKKVGDDKLYELHW